MVKRVNLEGSADRISSLPDSILGHIISYLPTKVAVSTCILLTRSRWTDILPFSNNLDFDGSLVQNPNDTSLFMDFVDRCIMLKNRSPIDKFRLKCSNAVDTTRIHSWICAALCSNVRELDLCIGRRKHGKGYSRVFTCKTLVVLKLGIGVSLNVTASVYFPCLKILHLENIRLAGKDSLIQRLISSCPVLEDLFILRCYMVDLGCYLSSTSLKKLTIDKPFDYRPYKLVLDTPSLVYLKFALCVREGHILKNLGSLREAHIHISYGLVGRIAYHELLERLANVQSLYLTGELDKLLRKPLGGLEELPLLKNLTRLVLAGRQYLEMSEVIQFLQCCPNLEEFVSHGSIVGGYDVPCCVPSRLKSIKCALFFNREAPYRQSITYFLKNANMLEKMQIYIPSDRFATHHEVIEKLETMMVTMNKLAKAPSRSKICKIKVFFRRERVIFSEVED